MISINSLEFIIYGVQRIIISTMVSRDAVIRGGKFAVKVLPSSLTRSRVSTVAELHLQDNYAFMFSCMHAIITWCAKDALYLLMLPPVELVYLDHTTSCFELPIIRVDLGSIHHPWISCDSSLSWVAIVCCLLRMLGSECARGFSHDTVELLVIHNIDTATILFFLFSSSLYKTRTAKNAGWEPYIQYNYV